MEAVALYVQEGGTEIIEAEADVDADDSGMNEESV